MTLVPQARLLIALLLGAVLILLVLVHPVFLILFLAYYAALLGFALADGARLPKKSGFMASRVLPQPFSLGEVQSVQVLVAHSEAAGLSAEVADHEYVIGRGCEHRVEIDTEVRDHGPRLTVEVQDQPRIADCIDVVGRAATDRVDADVRAVR